MYTRLRMRKCVSVALFKGAYRHRHICQFVALQTHSVHIQVKSSVPVYTYSICVDTQQSFISISFVKQPTPRKRASWSWKRRLPCAFSVSIFAAAEARLRTRVTLLIESPSEPRHPSRALSRHCHACLPSSFLGLRRIASLALLFATVAL